MVEPGGVLRMSAWARTAGGLDVRACTLQEITFIGTYTYTATRLSRHSSGDFDGRLVRLIGQNRATVGGATGVSESAGRSCRRAENHFDPWA